MKKVILALMLAGVSGTSLMADIETKETMRALAKAMGQIQEGFLYNHNGKVISGVSNLKSALVNINHFKIENKADTSFNAEKYAKTEMEAIMTLADSIKKNFLAGKKQEVLVNYQQTINRCVTCHGIIRKW